MMTLFWDQLNCKTENNEKYKFKNSFFLSITSCAINHYFAIQWVIASIEHFYGSLDDIKFLEKMGENLPTYEQAEAQKPAEDPPELPPAYRYHLECIAQWTWCS